MKDPDEESEKIAAFTVFGIENDGPNRDDSSAACPIRDRQREERHEYVMRAFNR